MADSFVADKADSFTPDAPAKATPKGDDHGVMMGSLLDTVGLTERPGKTTMLTNKPGQKTPLGVVVNPKDPEDYLASLGVTIPAYMGMPFGALGRTALAGTQGAGRAASEGQGAGGMSRQAIIDAIVNMATEGVGGAIRSTGVGIPGVGRIPGLHEAGAPARAFKHATEAPAAALDAIKPRLLNAKIMVPTITGGTKESVEDVVKKLAKLEGASYTEALEQLRHALNGIDKAAQQGASTRAGDMFVGRVSPQRFTPPKGATRADAADRGLATLQPAIDAVAATPIKGVTIGEAGAAKAADTPGAIWRTISGH